MDASNRIETVSARILALREAMRREGLGCWIALSSDPHLSEYLPARWQARAWLSGFGGSAGTLVVTPDEARLFTDARYWVDAQAVLEGTPITLHRAASAAGLELHEWASQQGAIVAGVDGASVAVAMARSLEAALARGGSTLRTDLDLMDSIWPGRPGLPGAPVREREARYEARTRAQKLEVVREAVQAEGAQWHVVSSLDDIAWILGLRGSDVECNPVFVSHLLIGPEQAWLFAAPGAVAPGLAKTLLADGVAVRPYAEALPALSKVPAQAVLLADPRRATLATLRALPQSVRVLERVNPSVLLKSRKAPSELAYVRQTMEQDGAALCEFFAWFEGALSRRERITELTIDEHVTGARARRAGFVSTSFATIAAFNANGASPHYRCLLYTSPSPRD